MAMKPDYISRIFDQFFNQTSTPEVTQKVQRWMVDDQWAAEKDDSLHAIWEKLEVQPDQSTARSLRRVKDRIRKEENRHSLNYRILLRIAAVIIPVALLVGGYFYFNGSTKNIEVTTLNNEQKQCTLPDGSSVRLNSGSKINYSSRFNDTTRLVTLEGEAYFSVKPNKKKPFIVKTKDLTLRVLGTEFNIASYSSDSRSVATLDRGKVQVTINREEKGSASSSYILKPNQQLAYNKSDQSVLINIVTEETSGWKDGALIFQDATFNDILNTLQRQYNVTFRYDAAKFQGDVYSVKFVNRESIEQVMNVLQDVVGGFSWQKNDNEIAISQERHPK
jgi:transmembrane sensor